MYESPIKILYGSMQHGIEEDMFKAILSYDIQVDKDELIRALKYDRNMYEAGYIDGRREALEELVRCKDCKSYDTPDGWGWCYEHDRCVNARDFCSYGERRSDD